MDDDRWGMEEVKPGRWWCEHCDHFAIQREQATCPNRQCGLSKTVPSQVRYVLRGRDGVDVHFGLKLVLARRAVCSFDLQYPRDAPHRVIEIIWTERDVTNA